MRRANLQTEAEHIADTLFRLASYVHGETRESS